MIENTRHYMQMLRLKFSIVFRLPGMIKGLGPPQWASSTFSDRCAWSAVNGVLLAEATLIFAKKRSR